MGLLILFGLPMFIVLCFVALFFGSILYKHIRFKIQQRRWNAERAADEASYRARERMRDEVKRGLI